MGRALFFLKETFRALRRNGAPSMAAIVTTVITMVLLGVLIPVFQAAQGKNDEVRDQLELKAFLYDDATQGEIDGLRQTIGEIPHVKSVEFVSKTEALQILSQRLKDTPTSSRS